MRQYIPYHLEYSDFKKLDAVDSGPVSSIVLIKSIDVVKFSNSKMLEIVACDDSLDAISICFWGGSIEQLFSKVRTGMIVVIENFERDKSNVQRSIRKAKQTPYTSSYIISDNKYLYISKEEFPRLYQKYCILENCRARSGIL